MSICALSLLLAGCGSGLGPKGSVQPDSTVHLNDAPQNRKVDVVEAKRLIKEQLTDVDTKDMYLASDKKSIFVLVNHRFLSTLYDFDISKDPPQLRGKIAEYPDNNIIKVVPLENGKLLYQQETPVNLTNIHIYDYLMKTELAKFSIWYENSIDLTIDSMQKFFMIDDIKMNISNLISQKPVQRHIKRDDIKQVIIDEENRVIWQDNYTVSDLHSVEEADDVCQKRRAVNWVGNAYQWRLPTIEDVTRSLVYYQRENSVENFSETHTADPYIFTFIKGEKRMYGIYNYDYADNTVRIEIPERKYKFPQAHVGCIADY